MSGRNHSPGTSLPSPGRETYTRVLANLASVLAALAGLAFLLLNRQTETPTPTPAPVATTQPLPAKSIAAVPPPPKPPTPVPEAPKLDTAAVAQAEASLDAASRDRARAEARAADASQRLADAAAQAAADARAAKTLAFRVRDPSTRITQASARGNFLKADRDRLKTEVGALATVPRPKSKILSNKNPVARPADGDENHFELRHNRASFIDLDRLITQVKADAQLRIRLADPGRVISSSVGPVGPFTMRYVLARAFPGGLDDLAGRRRISYDLRGWEIVPEFDGRGETYEAAHAPSSEFARVTHRLNPAKATITLWIYPDSFPLYRKLRDDLQARGFIVAARPLPEGMTIRGSPSGSLSAGQ